MGEKKMHFEHCPVPVANLAEGQEQPPCECTRPATYHGFTWEEEDVEQLDMAIADVKESSGAVALPGLEYIRNMVAVRVGRGPKPLGWDITQEES